MNKKCSILQSEGQRGRDTGPYGTEQRRHETSVKYTSKHVACLWIGDRGKRLLVRGSSSAV